MAGYKDYVLEFKLGDGTMHTIPFRIPLGENGGYYTPAISQISETEIEISYVPSMADMPPIEPVAIKIPVSDLTGYATEEWVQKGYQPKGDYLTYTQLKPVRETANDALTLATSQQIVETASGSVVAVSDASDLGLANLRIFGKTNQNGTPTPEAPVPLESVGDNGSVSIAVTGKNLLHGTREDKNGYYHIHLDCPLPPGTYYVSGKVTSTDTDNASCNVGFRKTSGEFVYAQFLRGDELQRKTVTVDLPVTYIRFLSAATAANSVGDTAVWTDVQIELAEHTDYEPPKEPSIVTVITDDSREFHLSGIPVNSGGNHTDSDGQQWVCNYIDFKRGKYVPMVGKIVLTGEEDWKTSSSGDSMYFYHILGDYGTVLNGLAMCDRFQRMLISSGNTHSGINVLNSDAANNARITCRPGIEGITDVETWKTWLAENNTTVLYLYGNGGKPEEIDLSAEELAQYAALHTNYPNTTIFNDGGAGMEVKYVADTKLYIDKKFAELAEAILNN